MNSIACWIIVHEEIATFCYALKDSSFQNLNNLAEKL